MLAILNELAEKKGHGTEANRLHKKPNFSSEGKAHTQIELVEGGVATWAAARKAVRALSRP